jgi:hypothetical protein
MVGSETLAMVVSSTCMKVPSASASAVIASGMPVMGGGAQEQLAPLIAARPDCSPARLRWRPGSLRSARDGGAVGILAGVARHGPAAHARGHVIGPEVSRTSTLAATDSPTRSG